ncbi:leucine-rich repeat-containing protein 19-like [Chiloscyllium punctatum]|uniref:leucine-rich repeat-containing protein 19-like n=1 Tax=Chiloscyllium punctatum TaxID=137246 RepID=UPI003B63CDFA
MTTHWFELWTGNFILTTAAIALSPCNFSDTTCDYSGKNLSSIPHDLPANTTKLKLMNNKISLTPHDIQILSNLTQLKELYLGYNLICNLISGAFNNFKKLAILELHNNCLTHVDRDVLQPLNLSCLTLYGNQWNCSCGFLGFQRWLNESQVHLGNVNITTCEAPEDMQFHTIEEAFIKRNGCFSVSRLTSSPDNSTVKSTLDTIFSEKIQGAAMRIPTVARQNNTMNQTNGSDQSKFGKSWKLVVGVMATSIGISSILILFAKFIKWYNCFFAYHHHRLQEEPDFYLENTSTETTYNVPQTSKEAKSNEQQTEAKSIPHNVSDDDGYIEDGYIDSIGFTSCEQ